MFAKKVIKARPRGGKLYLGLFKPSLYDQHIGEPPPDLRIGA